METKKKDFEKWGEDVPPRPQRKLRPWPQSISTRSASSYGNMTPHKCH